MISLIRAAWQEELRVPMFVGLSTDGYPASDDPAMKNGARFYQIDTATEYEYSASDDTWYIVPSGNGSDSNAVHYNQADNKTAAEQAQARDNIGQTAINAQVNEDIESLEQGLADEVYRATTEEEDLSTRIENLSSIGRFLAIWNATTGVATSDPPQTTYQYHTGDYFIIGVIGDRIPTGTSYTVGATNYETTTEELKLGDVYYYDGTVWRRRPVGAEGKVVDVQVNGTSILQNGVANIRRDANPTSGSSNGVTSGGVYTALQGKQPTLVSGSNIKTINNQSVLGSGNMTIREVPSSTTSDNGKFLRVVNGSAAWQTVPNAENSTF